MRNILVTEMSSPTDILFTTTQLLRQTRSLAMDFLWSLFSPQSRHRHYARVNQQGICVCFRHCSAQPDGSGWIEIYEPKLSWLHQPLPAHARISSRPRAITARQLLSI
jgi:hypothetical protein